MGSFWVSNYNIIYYQQMPCAYFGKKLQITFGKCYKGKDGKHHDTKQKSAYMA